MNEWKPIETAPKDGTKVWAYLFQTGIRIVEFESAQDAADRYGGDPDDFEGQWVESLQKDEAWEPLWWLPYDAIPQPPKPPK